MDVEVISQTLSKRENVEKAINDLVNQIYEKFGSKNNNSSSLKISSQNNEMMKKKKCC